MIFWDEKDLFEKRRKFWAKTSDFIQDMDMYKNKAELYKTLYEQNPTLDFPYKDLQSINSAYSHYTGKVAPSYNVIQMCVDSAYNVMASMKSKISFVTQEKSHEDRNTASKIDTWMLDTFKKGKIYQTVSRSILHSMVLDIGIIKIHKDPNKNFFSFTRVDPICFFVPNPYKNNIDKECCGEYRKFEAWKLKEMFPDKAKEISETYPEDDIEVEVRELYFKEKIHFIACERITYLDEKWEYDFLPYTFIHWKERTEGLIGVGIANMLESFQTRLTFLLEKLKESTDLVSRGSLIVRKGSQLNESNFTNRSWNIIELSGGEPPTVFQPPIMHPQYFAQIEDIYIKSFELTGVSRIHAHGSIPAGLGEASGVAMRTYSDILAKRFEVIRQNLERVYEDIARKVCLLAKKGDLPESLKRTNIKNELVNIQGFSTNLLPSEPSGQLAMVSEMVQGGLMNRELGLSMINTPDIKKFLTSYSARLDAINLQLEKGLENEDSELIMDEVLGVELQLDQARILYAELIKEDNPEKNDIKIAKLSNFINILASKIQESIQASAPVSPLVGEGQGQPQTAPQQGQ